MTAAPLPRISPHGSFAANMAARFDDTMGRTAMSEVDDRGARRRAAAQALVDRAKRESGLQSAVERTDGEMRRLRAEVERLASAAVGETSDLLEENRRLREENRRLCESDARYKNELERLSQELQRLQGEHERVSAPKAELEGEIKRHPNGETAQAAVRDAAPRAAEAEGDPSRHPPGASAREAAAAAKAGDRARSDPIDEVTDERARALLNSIRKRL